MFMTHVRHFKFYITHDSQLFPTVQIANAIFKDTARNVMYKDCSRYIFEKITVYYISNLILG